MLPEDKRKQLDGIVQKMVSNKETDANIRFVVDDFKKKYTQTPAAPSPVAPQQSLLSKAAGAVSSILPGGQLGAAIGNSAQGIWQSIAQRSLTPALQAGAENNRNFGRIAGDTVASAALPASIAITGGGSLLGSVAANAGAGAVLGGAQAASQGENIGQGAITGGLVSGGLAGTLGLAGKAIAKTGEEAYKFLIPRSAQEAKLIQTYKAKNPLSTRIATALSGGESTGPTTVADTAFRNGLKGTEGMLGIQARRASDNIWEHVISPSLKGSPHQVDLPTFFNEVENTIVKDNPELSRQKALLEGLNALKEDYHGVANVDLSKLQEFKEGWAKFIPEKAYQGKPIAGAFKEVQDTAADLARNTIYQQLGPEVKQAYFDYGNLKGVQELGQKAMTGGRLKGGFGSFWSAIKDEVLTPVATVGGRTVYRTGQGIEFVGKKGAAVISDIISPKSLAPLQSSPPPTQQTEQPQSQVSSPDGSTALKGSMFEPGITREEGLKRSKEAAFKIDPSGTVGAVEKVGAKAVPFTAKEVMRATSYAKDHLVDAMGEALQKGHIEDIGLERKVRDFSRYLTKKSAPSLQDLHDGEEYLRQAGIKGFKTLGHILEDATKQGRKFNGKYDFKPTL